MRCVISPNRPGPPPTIHLRALAAAKFG